MRMERAAAVQFFADLFDGEHHIPGSADAVKPWGGGWIVSAHPCTFATYDHDRLTRLVLMAHDRCVRAELVHGGPQRVRIAIWQRNTREGSSMVRHPTMEQTLANWRKRQAHGTLEHARERLPQLGLHGVLQSDWERLHKFMAAHSDEVMGRAWRGDQMDVEDTDVDVMIRVINQLAAALYRAGKAVP